MDTQNDVYSGLEQNPNLGAWTMLKSGDTPGCSKRKSHCAWQPLPSISFCCEISFIGIFRATRKKGVLIEVSCVLQTNLDGWSFYRWESKGRSPFSRKSPAPWGRMSLTFMMGPERPWRFFLGGNDRSTLIWNPYFPTNCNAHTPPFAIHLGVRTIRLANDVLHQAGSPKATKRPKNKKTTEDWTWTTRGIGGWYWFISFGRFKI